MALKVLKTLVTGTAYVWFISSVHALSPVYITIWHRILICSVQNLQWCVILSVYHHMNHHILFCGCIDIAFFLCFLLCLLRLLFWEEVISDDIRGNTQKKYLFSVKITKYIVKKLLLRILLTLKIPATNCTREWHDTKWTVIHWN